MSKKPPPWALTQHYGEKIALKWQFVVGVLGVEAPTFDGDVNDLLEHSRAASVLTAMTWKRLDLEDPLDDDIEDEQAEEDGFEGDEDKETSVPATVSKPVLVATDPVRRGVESSVAGRIEIATPKGVRHFVQERLGGKSWEDIAPAFGISAELLSIALLYAVEPPVSARHAIGKAGRQLLLLMQDGPQTAGELAGRLFPNNSRGPGKLIHVMERLQWQGFVEKRFDEATKTNRWECIKSMATNNDMKATLVLEYLIGCYQKWGRFPSLRQIGEALGIKGNAPILLILKQLEANKDIVRVTDRATNRTFQCLADKHRRDVVSR
jgi:hypothetical protein